MGVNLPAHLVVLKGTVRWVGDTEVLPGEQPGYKEYSQTEVRVLSQASASEHVFSHRVMAHVDNAVKATTCRSAKPATALSACCGSVGVMQHAEPCKATVSRYLCLCCHPQVLQMVGRAGRPQFDTHGIAVIMTSRDSTHRYQRLLAGQVSNKPLMMAPESCSLAGYQHRIRHELPGGTNPCTCHFVYTLTGSRSPGCCPAAGCGELSSVNLARAPQCRDCSGHSEGFVPGHSLDQEHLLVHTCQGKPSTLWVRAIACCLPCLVPLCWCRCEAADKHAVALCKP